MNDMTTTLELPRNLFPTTRSQPVLLPSCLERIAERNLDHQATSGLFAIGMAAIAILTVLGIAG